MAFYIITILGADVFMLLLSFFVGTKYFDYSALYIVLAVVLGTIGVIALDGIGAFLIRRLPERWFAWDKKIWNVSKKECRFYEAIGIKKWKDHILELGMFTSFSKREIAEPGSPAYFERFILECNYGALIHVENAVVGFVMILCFPIEYLWFFGMEIALVNAFLNLAPMCILRYNLPRLQRRRAILIERAEKSSAETTEK